MKHSFKDAISFVALCLLIFGSLAGFVGDRFWLLDYFSHFRIQYAAVLLILGVIFLVKTWWKSAAVAMAFAILNGGLVHTHVIKSVAPGDGEAETIRIAHCALLFHAPMKEKAQAYMTSIEADILCVTEFSEDWAEQKSFLKQRFPYEISAGEDAFAITLFSRFPFVGEPEIRNFWPESPTVRATIDVEGTSIDVIALHTYPPFSQDYSTKRNHQLKELGAWVGGLENPTLILGDFNITPWSPHFKRLLKTAEVEDSGVGWGMQPTWPSLLAPVWIPVDHVLFSHEFDVIKRFTGPFIGSDHFPLILDVAVSGAKPKVFGAD